MTPLTGPPGNSVIGGLSTVEVLWILPGQLDAAIAGWFRRFPAWTESREDAYLIVQSAAHRALDGGGSFRQLLGENPEVQKLLADKLGSLFNAEAGLEHIDVAFDRIGLAASVKP